MKTIHKADLQALYPKADAAFEQKIEQVIAHLPHEEGKTKMKKRVSAGLVTAATLLLLAFGALAAQQWGVMDFLFASPHEPAKDYIQTVSTGAGNEQMSIQIDSALCDGQYLVFDWTVAPKDKTRLVNLCVDSFTANGVRIYTDGTDDFDGCWLYDEWKDGEVVELPAELKDAQTLEIEMTIGIYAPTKPVFILPENESGEWPGYDTKLAKQKIAEGYTVVYSCDGWVIADDEAKSGVACVVGAPSNIGEAYERTEVTLRFTVDVAACAAAAKTLSVQGEYKEAQFTARYERAVLTPLGLYLDLAITPNTGVHYNDLFNGSHFELTDDKGNVWEDVFPSGGNGNSDDSTILYSYVWFGVTREQLPDVFGLSPLSEDGKLQYFFPVQ